MFKIISKCYNRTTLKQLQFIRDKIVLLSLPGVQA